MWANSVCLSRRRGRQPLQRVRSDAEARGMALPDLHAHGVERRLAAHAATRCRVEMPQQSAGIHPHMVGQFDADDVPDALVRARRPAMLHPAHVFRGSDDGLAGEEAHGQFLVVAGRAHGDGDALVHASGARFVGQADLQRLFDGDGVAGAARSVGRDGLDVYTQIRRGGASGGDVLCGGQVVRQQPGLFGPAGRRTFPARRSGGSRDALPPPSPCIRGSSSPSRRGPW